MLKFQSLYKMYLHGYECASASVSPKTGEIYALPVA